jgi:hypothetical protein
MKNTLNKKIIFLFCGIVNTIFSAATFYFLFPLLENILSNFFIVSIHFVIVIIFNFLNYNFFLYKENSFLIKKFLKFFLSNLIFVPFISVIFDFLYLKIMLNYFISFTLILCITATLTFLLNEFFVFKNTQRL